MNAKGYIFAGLAIYPGTTLNTLVRTTDGGETWSDIRSNSLMTGDPVDLAVDEKGMIYVIFSSSGLFRSEDDGKTWRAMNAGLDISTSRYVSVGPDGSIYLCMGFNVYKSTDKCESWNLIFTRHFTDDTRDVLLNKAGDIFVDYESGIAVSTDAGLNWSYYGYGGGAQTFHSFVPILAD